MLSVERAMEKGESHSNSYVIRIWREGDRPGWKGWVQHARTGEAVFIQRVDEILAFIERHTGKLTESEHTGLK
ncbi:MAG: hypothetical protein JXM73_18825 [Anaerolineae bacterium]|nr:hypothetical protein [Anaerolineae bacterium]